MPTLVKTFSFTADVESFVPTAGADSTLVWDASGALSSRILGRKNTDANTWILSGITWDSLGVPANSTITGVTAASCQYECTEDNVSDGLSAHGDIATANPAVTLVDGANTINLSQPVAFQGLHGSRQTSNGVDSTGLSLASGNAIVITINNEIDTGNNASAATTVLQDELTFTITYSDAQSWTDQGTIGSIAVTGLTGSVAAGVSDQGTEGAVAVTGYVSTLTITQNVSLQGAIGAIDVTGYVSTLQIQKNLTVQGTIGSVAVTGLVSTVQTAATAQGASGTIDVVGLTGSVQHAQVLQGTTGVIGATGLVSTVKADAQDQGTLGSVSITGLTGEAAAGVGAQGNPAPITITGLVGGTIRSHTSLQGTTGVVAVTGYIGEAQTGTFVNVQGSIGTIGVIGQVGEISAGAGFQGAVATIGITGLVAGLSLSADAQGSTGAIAVTGYAGFVDLIELKIGRLNSTLDFQIRGEITENAGAGLMDFDELGNLQVVELTEGATMAMNTNHELTVVTFEEGVDIT